MKYKIEKGDRFLCIKDYIMDDDSIAYTKGKTYLSNMDNYIIDNEKITPHKMSDEADFFEHFKPIKKNERIRTTP